MTDGPQPAPELQAVRWFNSRGPVTLAGLRGRIVVLHAFQMLCPGCTMHGLPQAQKLHRLFAKSPDVAVIGLHTVFEHHAAMTPVALEAFVHEYRYDFPIGVDAPGATGPIPATMAAYGMQGTPTLVLIDRQGNLRAHWFGQQEDLLVGVAIGQLLSEPT